MRERTIYIMVLLTLIGMIGIYYGLWRAYQEYQKKSAELGTVNGWLGLFSGR